MFQLNPSIDFDIDYKAFRTFAKIIRREIDSGSIGAVKKLLCDGNMIQPCQDLLLGMT